MQPPGHKTWIFLVLSCLASQVYCQNNAVDQDFLPSVTASCQGGLMTIKVETKQPFQGLMHVCDRGRTCKRDAACSVYGDGNTTASLRINLLARLNDSDYCGVYVNDRTSEKSVPVAVRFHRTLELGEDKYYVITCGRSAFRNSKNETADAFMRLLNEDDKRVTEAVYGRKYKLRVGINNIDSSYGFRPVSCFTYSGPNSNVIPLFDKRGCPEKRLAASKFRDSGKGWAEAELNMFRFPDANVINVQCDIHVCRGGCGEVLCDEDFLLPAAQGRAIGRDAPEPDGSLMASYSFYVVDPGDQALAVTDCSGIRPVWLLYLCIAFGVLFLIMLIINIFLCSAMTCSCTKTEVIEKEPSIIEEYDPYRSWHGSQYDSRYSLNGKPGYISAGSTMNSTRSYSTNSDHYAIVHSRPGSRYSAPGATGGHPQKQQQRNGHHGQRDHGPGPGSTSGSHYSGK